MMNFTKKVNNRSNRSRFERFRGLLFPRSHAPAWKGISACIIIAFLFLPVQGIAQDGMPFSKVIIEPPFDQVLSGDPDFMSKGGVRLFADKNGRRILIGIGTVFLEQPQKKSENEVRRAGEIRARAAILELVGNVEVSTIRGTGEKQVFSGEKMSLSSFFQTTKSSVREKIQQLPIIGSWSSNNRDILYIAVGKIIGETDGGTNITGIQGSGAVTDTPPVSGDEPFVSILRASPVLCRSGGVRGFILGDGRRVLITVASAKYKGSFGKAKRTSQLLAVRSLLGHERGIDLSSVELLIDSEQVRLSEKGEERISLSRFTSIQEEKVAGMVKALPIVATWQSEDGRLFYLAIGRVFDK